MRLVLVFLACLGAMAAAPELCFVERKDSGWEWVRFNPVKKTRAQLAQGTESMCPVHLALSKDGLGGAIWFRDELAGVGHFYAQGMSKPGVPTLQVPKRKLPLGYYFADFSKNVKETLMEIPKGELRDLGLDDRGRLQALSEWDAKVRKDAQGEFMMVLGKRLTVNRSLEGLPCAAVAYQWKAGLWSASEVKASASGADYAPGVRILDLWEKLGPRSTDTLRRLPETKEIQDADLQAALRAYAPALKPGNGDGWMLFQAAPKVAVFVRSGEFTHLSGALVFLAEGRPGKPENWPFTDGDEIACMVQGPWLLVSQMMTGASSRLYDLRSFQCVWSSDLALGTTFWP